ncbi:hypothetical protein WICPIJ_002404 [Wickerhamomyces pijperi]|uniref:Uncharacterized protein n=1 Tax=Wickerhamomyces pijperi TaxID=599730 RepID=A0A9P8QBT2_WICPI|nr:hypothetical protein WICPIJ_002404 [Wickerhamomyces pijperi]
MVVPCMIDSSLINSTSNHLKRPSVSFLTSEPKDVKRMCLGRRESTNVAAFYTDSAPSSSEDDDEDNDNSQDESCYLKNQMRARRRASVRQSRSICFVDNKLSRAVSQYSDDEDELASVSRKNSFRLANEMHHKLSLNYNSSTHSTAVENSSAVSCTEGKAIIKKSALDLDISARNRCFDYLVSAIDEAWALYCDATSYAEDEVLNKSYTAPAIPRCFRSSDNEDDDDQEEQEDDDFDAGYKSASTNITEYDSDDKNSSKPTSSVKLQQLKDRLLKAKYYLQDYLDSDELDEAVAFWRRWDLIKYATVELVEDDDEDDVVESTIEDLEKGRYHACY